VASLSAAPLTIFLSWVNFNGGDAQAQLAAEICRRPLIARHIFMCCLVRGV
jgi:hypothetical protein